MGPIVFFFLCMKAKAEANIFFQLQRLHQCIVRFAFATQWNFHYDLTTFFKHSVDSRKTILVNIMNFVLKTLYYNMIVL